MSAYGRFHCVPLREWRWKGYNIIINSFDLTDVLRGSPGHAVILWPHFENYGCKRWDPCCRVQQGVGRCHCESRREGGEDSVHGEGTGFSWNEPGCPGMLQMTFSWPRMRSAVLVYLSKSSPRLLLGFLRCNCLWKAFLPILHIPKAGRIPPPHQHFLCLTGMSIATKECLGGWGLLGEAWDFLLLSFMKWEEGYWRLLHKHLLDGMQICLYCVTNMQIKASAANSDSLANKVLLVI